MTVSKEKAGSLLDALLMESLYLVEEQAKSRVDIERLTTSGKLSLAQTRYQQSSMAITVAQIPTINSSEFNALCNVNNVKNELSICGSEVALKKHDVDKSQGYVEPLHWFSKLPSSSLRSAAAQFKKSVELAVESANLQRELTAVLDSIQRLRVFIWNEFNADAER